MSQQNWNNLDRKIYTILNSKNTHSFYGSYTRNVYFKDFLEHYKNCPADFSSDMVLDLNISVVGKINNFLCGKYKNNSIIETHKYESIYSVAKSDSVDKAPLYKVKSVMFCTGLENDVNTYSSKGKKNYASESKLIQEQLALFGIPPWYSNLTFNNLFQDVDAEKLLKTISIKNFLLSLEKYFSFLSNDNDYKQFKEDFFSSYYKSLKNQANSLFRYTSFNEILSFLRDSYNEEILKLVIEKSIGVPEYSYLKNKSAVDKIISSYPQSQNVLSAYINEINKDNVQQFFVEDNCVVVSLTIDFITVQKTLLLNKKKFSAKEVDERFKSLLKKLFYNKKELNLQTPLSSVFITDNPDITDKSYVSTFLFKVSKNDYNEFGETIIKDYLKRQFIDFIDNFPEKSFNIDKYEASWQKEIISKRVVEGVVIEGKVKKSIQKI